ncbi:MAG TPA: MBL fold metallo-hydrolase [Blastocatellia bacterium]|jgi:glyoxylase-like metal-dependent hydrolase (beta-lactamase superfamily II)
MEINSRTGRVRALFAAAAIVALCATGLGRQAADTIASELFDLKQVAPGVWALIVKRNTAGAVSNAAFIEIGDKVMVIDSHLTPRAAREAARIIAAVTNKKPVRLLVNTHWHPDHVQGNSTYSASFPGVIDIVSHVNTRRDIALLGTPLLKDQRVQLPKQIAAWKSQLSTGLVEARPMTETEKRQLEARIKASEFLLGEIQNLEVTLPTLTFDRSMALHAGEREVLILYFGRGHTEGDVVVFLPKEKVIVTGDLLTNGIPFMRDAYPLEWSQTLAGIEKLDFTQVIPGHGDVQQGKDRFIMLRAFLDDLIPAVRRAIQEGKTVEQAKVSIKAELAPKHEKNFPPGSWNGGAEASIERAYAHVKNARM